MEQKESIENLKSLVLIDMTSTSVFLERFEILAMQYLPSKNCTLTKDMASFLRAFHAKRYDIVLTISLKDNYTMLCRDLAITSYAGNTKFVTFEIPKARPFVINQYVIENDCGGIKNTYKKINSMAFSRESIEIINQLVNPNKNYILVKTTNGDFRKIYFNEIALLEAIKFNTRIYLISNEVVATTLSQKKVLSLLSNDFLMIHRSYGVNLNQINSFENSEIRLKTGFKLQLTKNSNDKLKARLKLRKSA